MLHLRDIEALRLEMKGGWTRSNSSDFNSRCGSARPPPPCFQKRVFESTDGTACSDFQSCSMLPASTTPFTPPPMGTAFHAEVFALAEKVAELLRKHECAPKMHVCILTAACNKGDFTMTMTLCIEHMGRSPELVRMAKDTFCSYTRRGLGICLIGHKRKPFKTTETGFNALFGSVSPRRRACRPFYEIGTCKHDENCWWQHPQTLTSIDFVLEVSV